MHQEALGDINNEFNVKSLVQPHSLQKEAIVITDASEKTIGGVLSQGRQPVICIEIDDSSAVRLLKHRA